jgi:hypothetical protein
MFTNVGTTTASELFFKVISAIGAITGSWALIRSYWLTRSKLVLSQNVSRGSRFHNGGEGILELTVLVRNLSSQSNAIVRWDAWFADLTSKMKPIDMPSGRDTDTNTREVVREWNLIPFNIPPHGAVNCHLDVWKLKKSESAQPFKVKVRATDMYGKKYDCICVHDVSKER